MNKYEELKKYINQQRAMIEESQAKAKKKHDIDLMMWNQGQISLIDNINEMSKHIDIMK